MHEIRPDWHNVKPLGRTWEIQDEGLLLAFSGAGAEFAFSGTSCEVKICGDCRAADPQAANDHARIAIFLDGERTVDAMLTDDMNAFFITAEAGEHVVRVVKLSETAMSVCLLHSICAENIRPTAQKAHLVEFVGDSITCGYGVDDEDPEHPFTTATEDVTRAYAYKAAQLLDADYSMASISGYGIISGYTATAEERVTAQLLPAYYEKLGFSYGAYHDVQPQDIGWDFTRRQPDLVVVNLGTNDDSYCLDHADRQAHYCAEYVNFLKVLRRCNPGAKLLCTLGIMGDRLYPFVEQAASAYTAQTGDGNIACMPFVPQLPEDGHAADYHPTARTHDKAAARIAEEIRCLMNW